MHSADYYDAIRAKLPMILAESGGIIATAAKKAGISRDCFHTWLHKYPEFAKECAKVRDHVDDFFESEFIKLVRSGNPAAIIYAAKTRLRHRGYGSDVTLNYGDSFNITGPAGDVLTVDEQNTIECYVQQRIAQHEAKMALRPINITIDSENNITPGDNE